MKRSWPVKAITPAMVRLKFSLVALSIANPVWQFSALAIYRSPPVGRKCWFFELLTVIAPVPKGPAVTAPGVPVVLLTIGTSVPVPVKVMPPLLVFMALNRTLGPGLASAVAVAVPLLTVISPVVLITPLNVVFPPEVLFAALMDKVVPVTPGASWTASLTTVELTAFAV